MIKATATWMNVYGAKHRDEGLEIEKVEPKKFNEILQHFFTKLKKRGGEKSTSSAVVTVSLSGNKLEAAETSSKTLV